jgi:RNA polymerase sigma-70 factor, ECF subfamily
LLSRFPARYAIQQSTDVDWWQDREHGVSTSEQTLIDQWRGGDPAAFAAIIERHQRVIFGYLRARLVQASDAEDMTQEVFLRFHLAQARFDSNNLIRPWLLGIARNLLREHVRSLRRRKEVAWTELCLELESVAPFDPHAADDALTHLPVCLESLGPSARQAIELKYRSEQKLADIGKQLHRSEGAVKLLVHRARQALRDCLDQKSKAASRT